MSETILLGPPPATLAILLDDPDAHDFPAVERILGGLTPEQATTIPRGFLSYSIALIGAATSDRRLARTGPFRHLIWWIRIL